MTIIEQLDADSWESFLSAPLAVLILSKTECSSCISLIEELNIWISTGTVPLNVRFGKILLDTPGMGAFKLAQPWVSEIDILPFNAIFINGEHVQEWAGGNLSRLQNQLERLL